MDIGISKGELKPVKPMNKFFKKLLIFLLLIFVITALMVARVQTKYLDKIIKDNELQGTNIGLVFGAGLRKVGQPSAVLQDRIKTAIKLYQDNRIGRFIFSADSATPDYDEVTAMKNFALQEGLPESAMIEDKFGTNTYQSCYRLKNEFGLSSAVLITQRYHLPRALYYCQELGIDALGIASLDRGYPRQLFFTAREYLASLAAWFKINF